MAGEYIPQVDNFNAVEAFVRRMYNPSGNRALDAKISIQPYAYALSFEAVAAGAAPVQTLQIAANADFVLTSPRFRAVVDAVGPLADSPNPLVRVLLTDTGSQEQFMSQLVDINTFFGKIDRAEYTLMYPRVISGRSGLQVQLQNYSNILGTPTAYLRIELTFAGVLVRGF